MLPGMAQGRGPVMAWSASVASIAGGFAGFVWTHVKSPLDNPLFELLAIVAVLAFLILIAAGLPDAYSLAAETVEKVRPPRRLKLKHWRYTTDGARPEVRSLANPMSLELPATGYMAVPQDRPPWIRLVALVACTEVSPDVEAGEAARDRFQAFLAQPPVMSVVRSLTHVAEQESWVRWSGYDGFDAVLGQAGEGDGVASARLVLPWGIKPDWRERRYATLILHVVPRDQAGRPAPPAGPEDWVTRLTMALALLPGGLAAFLSNELGSFVTGDPPAVLGIHMAAHDMTELIDVNGVPPLPGTKRLSEAGGYFFAESGGYRPWVAARQMVVDTLRYALGVNARAARWPWERASTPAP
jgi:hypothetical protein